MTSTVEMRPDVLSFKTGRVVTLCMTQPSMISGTRIALSMSLVVAIKISETILSGELGRIYDSYCIFSGCGEAVLSGHLRSA